MDFFTWSIVGIILVCLVVWFIPLICFIIFIWIGIKLWHIRDFLKDISKTFEEFNKKINQINIESKK